MRIFVAGATGAIGRPLLPMLVEAGHEVVGMTRSKENARGIRDAGAQPVVADALDADALAAVVQAAEPDVLVHQLTAIPPVTDGRGFAEQFEATNRLRREGTRNLVAAARSAGARRLVAQGLAQAYAPVGGWVKSEDDPLYADAEPPFGEIFGALIDLEAAVLGAADLEGLVLRYGSFYGPGTAYAADGSNAELVRRGLFPVAGGGPAHWSFVHVEDAARATALAVERGEPGVYNIVDDEPAALADWLPVYAEALGAPPPPEAPAPRGTYGTFGMMLSRGASNARAKQALGWTPRHASWRDGFAAMSK
jgi:nucleoside-diphosphate-sugar epimerase